MGRLEEGSTIHMAAGDSRPGAGLLATLRQLEDLPQVGINAIWSTLSVDSAEVPRRIMPTLVFGRLASKRQQS